MIRTITRERIRQLEKRALKKLSSNECKEKLLSFLQDTADTIVYSEIFNYVDEDDSLDDIYNENYDYKKPPIR